ncbi:MAG: glycosyltransferase family 4 protein [Lentisphaeria bacterium]|nr:glycosyltransferase family 4 protein [Lentisphaeria bacterium]
MERLFLDATIVRTPRTGVQNSVLFQAQALMRIYPERIGRVACSDEKLLDTAMEAEIPTWSLSPSWSKPMIRLPWQQTRLPRIVREEWLFAMGYTAPVSGLKAKLLLQVHDLIALLQPELCRTRNSIHYRSFMPAAIRNAEKLLVSSTFVADQLIQKFDVDAKRIVRIPMGINPVLLDPKSSTDGPEPPIRNPYILHVGTLEPKKGIMTLLRAYARSQAAKEGVILVLCGKVGWRCRTELKFIENYDGPGKIVRVGYVPDDSLAKWYRRAKCFVFPSITEGYGLPILEAMSQATPVLHSNISVLTETAGNEGIPFQLGSEKDLQDKIDEVVLRGGFDTTSAENFAKTRTWKNWADQLDQAIDSE